MRPFKNKNQEPTEHFLTFKLVRLETSNKTQQSKCIRPPFLTKTLCSLQSVEDKDKDDSLSYFVSKK